MGARDRSPLRMATAASLFDGHDSAINLVRRLLVAQGVQVVHLGHNRSVSEIVKTALEEDVNAVCVSSYQGGHMEYFSYLVDCLRSVRLGHVLVFGGGGGVILPEEALALERLGVAKIYTPDDGMRLGIEGMVADLVARVEAEADSTSSLPMLDGLPSWQERRELARWLTQVLDGRMLVPAAVPTEGQAPIIGLTGTGGAGKSSLLDELIRRLLADSPNLRIAVLSIDPTRKRSGGALLGDRLRLNSVGDERVFFRSIAAEDNRGLVAAIGHGTALLRLAGASLILVETTGIGQADTDIVEMADLPIYVMTSEFGAGTQLEKINMLDFAQLIVVNKFEDKRAEDALQAVRRQVRRNQKISASVPDEDLPVYGTSAGHFNDAGVDSFYLALVKRLRERYGFELKSRIPDPGDRAIPANRPPSVIPFERNRYLQEIVQTLRDYKARTRVLAQEAERAQILNQASRELEGLGAVREKAEAAWKSLGSFGQSLLAEWGQLRESYSGATFTFQVRGQERTLPLTAESLSGTSIRRVELPDTDRWGEIVSFLRLENVPGRFPFTAGVFPFRRQDEEPKRQFAGEGGPERTNHRFHFLCEGEKSHRLSTAFDSVTLYGEDPDERMDIFGKVGESGVSIATLEDMKTLYRGVDLCAPGTSVSMTINGPAPVLLAMFFNTAIDQKLERYQEQEGVTDIPADVAARIRSETLQQVRGTVQADILKEDQAQNTCLFSVEFALRLMGDVQAFFVRNKVLNYYSASVSGYHIAEAGANPVTQLAFTLANGFTLVEYYLSRGMSIDEITPNLSFFFSSGLDPEYSVIGRVARRIWAIALRERYGASVPGCRLKYHVQTSGRSLHLKEMKFNNIRTTLQALTALTDNCNSLHTNAYDEALTTPTEESVRLAMAIQLILTREFGPYRNENPLQGSYFYTRLTEDVEEAVLEEFLRINARGGVLAAMETQYQRFRIQEQSLLYELKKHSGELPIVGVNTFLREEEPEPPTRQLSRTTHAEKHARIQSLRAFQVRHAAEAGPALARLRAQGQSGGNLFEVLMEVVRVASLGQITAALYDLGGKYRRAM